MKESSRPTWIRSQRWPLASTKLRASRKVSRPPGAGDSRAHAVPNVVGLGQNGDRIAERLAHLGLPVEPYDATRVLADQRLGLGEGLSVCRVELSRDVARQLEMLALVLAHRNRVRLVEQDVGGLEDRIIENARRNRLEPL